MKHVRTQNKNSAFGRLLATGDVQAVLMILQPGEASCDDLESEHPRCEQWMYVVSGTGEAKARQHGRVRTVKLAAGSLVVIERQEAHQVRCTGWRPLRTVNFYVPPAYDEEGEVLPSAKHRKRS